MAKFDELPTRGLAAEDYVLIQSEGGPTSRTQFSSKSIDDLGLVTTEDVATSDANGLMSAADKKKLDTITGGAVTSVVLADGTTATIASILQNNIETIRAALGVATTSKDGLLPKLPENPNA